MFNASQIPTLFTVQDVLRGAYPARIQEFTEAGQRADIPPADEDQERIAVVLVDYQYDFVAPDGSLYVPGSQEDIARFLVWFYTNAQRISSVYTSLDTHLPLQIFFSSWWRSPETGQPPLPFTEITVEDITNNVWTPLFEQEWSIHYVHMLKQKAKKNLMIWPYHTMQGTLGHMLSAPISEALAWYSAARNTQAMYIVKGLTTRSEFYGIFGAEIADPKDATSNLNITLLDAVMKHDRVYIAGEAKSHCVLESERQLIDHFKNQPEFMKRLHILTDCTSSVKHPLIDFEALTESELKGMEQLGVQMVLSTDPRS